MNIIALFCTMFSGLDYNITIALAAGILAVSFRMVKMTPLHWLWLAFLVWAILGSLLCDYPSLSFLGHQGRKEGALWLIIATAIAFQFEKKWFLLTVIFLTVLGWFLTSHGKQTIWPSMDFPRYSGSFAALAGVILFYRKPWLAVLVVPILIKSHSRAAGIAMIFGCFVVWACQRRWFPWTWTASGLAFAVLIGFYGVFSMNSHFGTGVRSNLMLQGRFLASVCPITGFGMDTLSKHLTKPACSKEATVDDSCHYAPLDIVLRFGWIGYAMLLSMVGYLLTDYRRNALKLGVAAAWLAFSCLNPPGTLAHQLLLIVLFL